MLTPGTRLGPYEILAPLGAGGMGEVWKAKDTRLDRLVAIKVLPEHLSSDAEALARFEREAKVVAGLSHPNITALFDIGRDGGAAYAVMELLEGESLRARVAHGPMPARRVVELGIQMAHGLAAAHGRGILHRDLKPDNLWITKEGRIKILDFGLAKVMQSPLAESGADEPTVALDSAPPTKAGVVLGTVGYMSPEQVRGLAVDPRSDLFSLGVVLWEMLAGQRPFQGDSAIETLHAILAQEPPTLPPTLELPQELLRILDHCLQKNPDARFQTARDLGFALENLSNGTSRPLTPIGTQPSRRIGMAVWWAGGGMIPLVALLGFAWGRHHGIKPPDPPGFHALLQRPVPYTSAVVAPGGRSILFTKLKPDGNRELMAQDLDVPRPRSFGLDGYDILGISSKGDLALLRRSEVDQPWGMLALAPAGGGAPRDALDNVLTMAWHPDGVRQAVAVNHPELGAQLIEFPAGKEVYRVPYGKGMNPRLAFSPDGEVLAFITGPRGVDELCLLTPSNGACRTFSIPGLSDCLWTQAGLFVIQSTPDQEAWVDRMDPRSGSRETLARLPLPLEFQAAFPDGDLLVGNGTTQAQITWEGGGKPTRLTDAQGLEIEDMDGTGDRLVYSNHGGELWVADRRTPEPTLIGKGDLASLSPDGDAVIAKSALGGTSYGLTVFPLGQGRPIQVPGSFQNPFASLLPGGKRLLIFGPTPDGEPELQIMTLDGKVETRLGKFAIRMGKSSPDDRLAMVFRAEADQIKAYLMPLHGGEPQPLDFQGGRNLVLGWLRDGSGFYWGSTSPQSPYEVHLRDLRSGKDQIWKSLKADSSKGVLGIEQVQVSADGRTFAYMVTARPPALLYRLSFTKP